MGQFTSVAIFDHLRQIGSNIRIIMQIWIGAA